ncbi:MAG: type II toxin-antitoxin system Phd/YefM family antitoxin [Candidatus Binatia bacterium]
MSAPAAPAMSAPAGPAGRPYLLGALAAMSFHERDRPTVPPAPSSAAPGREAGEAALMVLDPIPYSPYSSAMNKPQHRGAEEARNQLPQLLAEAEKGQSTIITRHGRSVAALVPLDQLGGRQQRALTTLAGSGKGLLGRDAGRAVQRLREEWNR